MQDLYAVIGDPIEHSVSPIMHGKWLKDNHLNHHYHAFEVAKTNLKEAILGIRAIGVKGFNVTIPHKMAIMPYLDVLDDEAKVLGAVNTVINHSGKLIGTNTDGQGFIQALKDKGFQISSGGRLLVIGAGGAARAVGLALGRQFPNPIDFTNRSIAKAKKLADEVGIYTKSSVLPMNEAARKLADYQMVIQATPVGMSGFSDEIPFLLDHLQAHTQCVDLIYKPLKTRFLTIAESKGCRVMNGLPMLIHQGAMAFYRWHHIYPDTSEMEAYLTNRLTTNQ